MADQQLPPHLEVKGRQVVDCGGLRFEATFREPAGATLRVFGDLDGQVTELLRFDDFVDSPHYHIPAASDPIAFDQAELGEPLTWLVSQLRDNLAGLFTEAGLARALPGVNLDTVTYHVDDIRKAMEICVPDGYLRVPGVGLRRSPD